MDRIKRHLLNLYGVEPNLLTTSAQVGAAIDNSLKSDYLEYLLHQFHVEGEEQGVTGLYMWPTGHLSIHTWPERNMAAVDVVSLSAEDNLLIRLKESLPGNHIDNKEKNQPYNVGREVVGYFSQCESLPQKPEGALKAISDASKEAGFHAVGELSYDSGKQFGAGLVLSESHFTIHVDKSTGLAYVDCFTCGSEGDPCTGIELLADLLKPRELEQNFLYR